jgi:hypothetical protein
MTTQVLLALALLLPPAEPPKRIPVSEHLFVRRIPVSEGHGVRPEWRFLSP